MKSKGFTLIELLAVIVILALIALVTIPMINNVIEKAKKGALEDSVYGLKSAAELYYGTTGTSETIEFTCDETGCKDGDKKLPFKGTVNLGRVKLFSDGKVSICIEDGGYASHMMVKDKKATTTTGSCNYSEEEYAITELVSANEYKKVKADLDLIKESLYNKTLISSTSNSAESIANDINNIDLNQGEAANKKTIVDSLQYSELGITEDMSWEEIAEILSNRFSAVPTGTVYNFSYTGNIQKWECDATGLYKLEVYGGSGGSVSNGAGGAGGYSVGYVELTKGDELYVVVGGAGASATNAVAVGGYNGGGSVPASSMSGGGGGGATHIATATGTLKELGVSNKNKILIVAGGGGGGANQNNGYNWGSGGSGGGSAGGTGTHKYESDSTWMGTGGTQTSAGTCAVDSRYAGGFGYGGSGSGGGGGGGFYGGGASETGTGAGGGSGYIGGVPSITYASKSYVPSTANGKNSGNGKAVITYIAK